MRFIGGVQQKPQNDKRARRCYRCDPLGHVCQYALVADLALIVGPSYSSMGPSGVIRTTRRGPIVSNLAPSGLFLVGALPVQIYRRQVSWKDTWVRKSKAATLIARRRASCAHRDAMWIGVPRSPPYGAASGELHGINIEDIENLLVHLELPSQLDEGGNRFGYVGDEIPDLKSVVVLDFLTW